MNVTALVVEDDPKVPPLLKGTFTALKQTFEIACSLQAARAMLEQRRYDYVIVDLTIPADDDGVFPDRQYGLMLIREIRETHNKASLPIIVMTSYVEDGFGLSTELCDLGVNACVAKSSEKLRGLLGIINGVLLKPRPPAHEAEAEPRLEAFSNTDREMVIYTDAITVCGIVIWKESKRDDMRKVCTRLSSTGKHGYDHVSGRELMKLLGRNTSNPIAKPIREFRSEAMTRLETQCSLACGLEDIISSKRGYHFQPWIRVSVVDRPIAECLPKMTLAKPTPVANSPKDLNDRQKWIMAKLERGTLRLETIVRHCRRNRSTINRDLSDLRKRGLIYTRADGYYLKAKLSS